MGKYEEWTSQLVAIEIFNYLEFEKNTLLKKISATKQK